MPWLETSPVDQRERFIADARRGLYPMTELCARYGISRKSGYKWLTRFEEGGRAALRDRSRAPHQCPHRIAAEVAQLICAARCAHPSWGPAKLLAWLEPRHPGVVWPAVSTAGDLLARRGLVKKRRRRRPHQHPGVVPLEPPEAFRLRSRLLEALRCHERHLPNRITQGDRFLIPDISGQHSCMRAGPPRVILEAVARYGDEGVSNDCIHHFVRIRVNQY